MDDTDADGERPPSVDVSDFDAVCEHLRAWCEPSGEFRRETVDGVERAVCDFGRATLVVTATGGVEGGMPLHGFDGRAERLRVEDDAVHVEGPDVSYTYRRP